MRNCTTEPDITDHSNLYWTKVGVPGCGSVWWRNMCEWCKLSHCPPSLFPMLTVRMRMSRRCRTTLPGRLCQWSCLSTSSFRSEWHASFLIRSFNSGQRTGIEQYWHAIFCVCLCALFCVCVGVCVNISRFWLQWELHPLYSFPRKNSTPTWI